MKYLIILLLLCSCSKEYVEPQQEQEQQQEKYIHIQSVNSNAILFIDDEFIVAFDTLQHDVHYYKLSKSFKKISIKVNKGKVSLKVKKNENIYQSGYIFESFDVVIP